MDHLQVDEVNAVGNPRRCTRVCQAFNSLEAFMGGDVQHQKYLIIMVQMFCSLHFVLTFPGKGIQEQPFSAEYRPILVFNLSHGKGFPGGLEELHVGPPPLLETEENNGRRFQRQQVLQRLQKQRESGLEVDAIGSKNNVGLEIDNFL